MKEICLLPDIEGIAPFADLFPNCHDKGGFRLVCRGQTGQMMQNARKMVFNNGFPFRGKCRKGSEIPDDI